ncbi:MAG: hypothetical protein H6722_26540 [Sandaracinus sp.]|nr:hypothetical protein [Sandaracinus sp.]
MMRRCPRCESFVPLRARFVGQPDVCPECGLRVPSAALRSLRNVAAGASAVMTLMACYGAAYYQGDPGPTDPCEGYDQDHDGVCSDVDCDDADAQVGACEESSGDETDTQPLDEPAEEPTEDLDGA